MSSNQSGEGEIRKKIVEADLMDCMVALPGQLFYSTQIPACLWFLARDRKTGRFRDRRGQVLFIDARKMGRMADRTHRELTDEEIQKIARAYLAWRLPAPQSDPLRQAGGLPAHLYDLFPNRLVGSELGEIPEGWKVGALGDVAEHLRRGIQPDRIGATTPYIALEHMPQRCIALSQWSSADGVESDKSEFKKGEILFGKLRPYSHKVGLAPVDGVCSTDIVVVTPQSSLWLGFVLGHVSSEAFVQHTSAGSTGTKMPRTS